MPLGRRHVGCFAKAPISTTRRCSACSPNSFHATACAARHAMTIGEHRCECQQSWCDRWAHSCFLRVLVERHDAIAVARECSRRPRGVQPLCTTTCLPSWHGSTRSHPGRCSRTKASTVEGRLICSLRAKLCSSGWSSRCTSGAKFDVNISACEPMSTGSNLAQPVLGACTQVVAVGQARKAPPSRPGAPVTTIGKTLGFMKSGDIKN